MDDLAAGFVQVGDTPDVSPIPPSLDGLGDLHDGRLGLRQGDDVCSRRIETLPQVARIHPAGEHQLEASISFTIRMSSRTMVVWAVKIEENTHHVAPAHLFRDTLLRQTAPDEPLGR